MGILRKQYTVVKLIYSIAAMTTSGGQTLCKYYGSAVIICMLYTATFRDIHTASNTDLILVKIQTDNKMNILNVYVKNV